ncbi:ATP-binding protein [Cytobacillus dafuensis]|uniref:histidine kinase n=1 Tax=Cytobacillus dafuensis TaxID=1742359 RepID=A0A5B8Z4F0_CYTDA|nr:sensor histidine kinase [Cytobacillus dafuensis]QED47811.1 two-component sensor histidine kinase [Cytobacillus dafuensis]
MLEMFKGLIINLLFILILILLINMLLWNKHKTFRYSIQQIYWFIIAAVQIILCLLFSVPTGDGFLYDLRFIPFLLGGFYGGKRVTFSLAIFLLLIRFFIGGDGFWVTLFSTTSAAIIIIILIPHYFKKSFHMKIVIVTIFSFCYSIVGYLVPSFIFGFHDFKAFVIYSVMLTASTFFVSYLLEILREKYILHLEAMKLEKMEIVSHLAASISHEVRNPLTAVIGFLQLIAENTKTTEDNKAYAKYAIEEATRASEIINDYLTFAKPHPEEECKMSIEQEIKKSIDILRPLLLKQNVETNVSFQHTGLIKGDPHKFHQVLLNIIKNSIEAMPNGGSVLINTSEENRNIYISIADTGHGMSAEHVARLGEPYFSLKGQKGTGLGMMVVYKIVESMNGSVEVESEYQTGTTITLIFPKIP